MVCATVPHAAKEITYKMCLQSVVLCCRNLVLSTLTVNVCSSCALGAVLRSHRRWNFLNVLASKSMSSWVRQMCFFSPVHPFLLKTAIAESTRPAPTLCAVLSRCQPGLAMRKLRSLQEELRSITQSGFVADAPRGRIAEAVKTESKRRALDTRIEALKTLFSSEALRLFPDFQQRLKVRPFSVVLAQDHTSRTDSVACVFPLTHEWPIKTLAGACHP